MKINKKDELTFSTIFNLFYYETAHEQVLYGKKDDLLRYFVLSFKNSKDKTHVMNMVTRKCDPDVWYKVRFRLEDIENGYEMEIHEPLKKEGLELDKFMLEYDKHLENDYDFDVDGNLQKVRNWEGMMINGSK